MLSLFVNERKVLKAIYASGGCITAPQIAQATGIKTRNVYAYISKIRKQLLQNGIQLVSLPGKGYGIVPCAGHSVKEIESTIERVKLSKSPLPITFESRVNYILLQLLISGDYIKISEFAEQMYLSRGTITKLVGKVRSELSSNGIDLMVKPGHGIKVNGNEMTIRSFAGKVLFEDYRRRSERHAFMEYVCIYFGETYVDICKKMIQITMLYNIQMSDVFMENYLLYMTYAVFRLNMGYDIEFIAPTYTSKSKDYRAVADMASYASENHGVKTSKRTVEELAFRLICVKIPNSLADILQPELTIKLTNKVLDTIFEETLIDFRGMSAIKNELMFTLNQTMVRAFYNIDIPNPFSIHNVEYSAAVFLADIATNVIMNEYKKKISEAECSLYVALFYFAITTYPQGKKRALILNADNSSIGYIIQAKIGKACSDLFESISTYFTYQLPFIDPAEYDMIITTKNADMQYPIHSITISHNADDNDIARIRDYFYLHFSSSPMELCFHPSLFFPHCASSSVREVAETIAEKTCKMFVGADRNQIIRAICPETVHHGTEYHSTEYHSTEYDKFVESTKSSLMILNNVPSIKQNLIITVIPEEPIVHSDKAIKLLIIYLVCQKDRKPNNEILNCLENMMMDDDSIRLLIADHKYSSLIHAAKKHV